MEVEFTVSEIADMDNLPVRDHQAGGTVEMNCLESLEENRNRDSLALIQPAVQIQQSTALKAKTANYKWFNDISEKWKNRKGKGRQETSHSPGKENQLKTPHNPKPRACKQATKKSCQSPRGKRKLSDTKLSWNGDTNKKAKSTEKDQCDPTVKENLTETPKKPQTSNDPKNSEYTGEANLHPENKYDIQSNTKLLVITFISKRKEKNRSVEKDKPVIYYAKQFVGSENIILYSCKREAIINPYVPCRALGQGEKIEIIPRKQSKNKATILSSLPDSNYDVCGEGIFFKVQSKGCTEGDGSRHILHNDKYNWKNKPLAVYGRADQTIEEAIDNDKRFNITTEFSLKNTNKSPLDEMEIKLSFLDPNVVYTVQVTNNKKPDRKLDPKTQNNGGLQSSDEKAQDSQNDDEIRPEVPQTDPKVQLTEMPKKYRTPTSDKFSSAFNNVASKVGRNRMRSDLTEDYKHNVIYKEPMLATTQRLLTQHLDSVGLIQYTSDKGSESGTFFLLTENLGLTCYHVLNYLIESGFDWVNNPIPNGKVVFNYESESSVVHECNPCFIKYHNKDYDFVFVQISQAMPERGLLQYVAPPPQDGAVSILGHPGASYKKLDPMCSVVSFSKRADAISNTILSDKSYTQVILKYSFMSMTSKQLLTYDTCLYNGASGAPVFDDRGGLVAMHCGGYLADTHLHKKSIIEYGVNIPDILIFGAINIRELRSSLHEVIRCNENLHSYMMNYTQQGAHSDMMQPVIRVFLKCMDQSNC